MWPSWEAERYRIASALQHHSQTVRALPGIAAPRALETLALQFVASLRREAYYASVQRKSISAGRADPNDPSFNAERALAHHVQRGNIEEAAWLAFLMTYFGRPVDTGWRRLQDVYGKLGAGVWDWRTVSADPTQFTSWLNSNWRNIRGKFGSHRKYESLRHTGQSIESYVAWVGPGGHASRFANAVRRGGNDPHAIFDELYRTFDVWKFGRLGKFDYLCLLGRYGIAPIDAGSAYLRNATGPLNGARLLFDGQHDSPSSPKVLQPLLDNLDSDLRVSMKVMEDALCNWQKSPTRFMHFKG